MLTIRIYFRHFLLDEIYEVNQRNKDVRVDGAYNLSDDGSSQKTLTKPSLSKMKILLSNLDASSKKAVQNAKYKFKKYSTPHLFQ